MAYPTLRQNEIFSALYNQIISIDTYADNIKGTNSKLVDAAKVDGGLYGDTKVYIATDCLKSAPWGNDAEAANLLALHRPPQPKTQTLTIDQFRQICLTVDNYLTKRAFASEGAFSQFNSAILGWISDTRKIYDATTYNVFIGTTESAKGKQTQSVGLASKLSGLSGEEKNRVEAQTIAQFLADLFVEMTDVNRDYNDNGFLRSVSEDDIKVIFNSKYLNKITKLDLPTIFHNDSLVSKLGEYKLPARYFGRAITSADVGADKVINTSGIYDKTKGTLRVYNEMDVTVGGQLKHFFAGDEIPNGAKVKESGGEFQLTDVYLEDPNIICKVITKLPPYMSAFEVGTSFFNPKSLTENHYLTFGRSSLDYLKNYPFVTIKA